MLLTQSEKSDIISDMNYTSLFKDSVEAFLARHEMADTTFGRLTVNDPNLVNDLREGRSPGTRTCDKVAQWMNAFESKSTKPKRPRKG